MKFLQYCVFVSALMVLVLAFPVLAVDKAANITVINSYPFIYDKWELSDDDDYSTGTQVFPEPGGNKTVVLCVLACDKNGFSDLRDVNASVYYPDSGIKETLKLSPAGGGHVCRDDSKLDGYFGMGVCEFYSGNFTMHFWEEAGNYTVIAEANDSLGASGTGTNLFEYLQVIGIESNIFTVNFRNVSSGSVITVDGDNDMTTAEKPTIRNIGNVDVDLSVSASNIKCITPASCHSTSIPAPYLTTGFSPGVYNLTIPGNGNAYGSTGNPASTLPLERGEMSMNPENFRLAVPQGVLPGNYSATVMLTEIMHT